MTCNLRIIMAALLVGVTATAFAAGPGHNHGHRELVATIHYQDRATHEKLAARFEIREVDPVRGTLTAYFPESALPFLESLGVQWVLDETRMAEMDREAELFSIGGYPCYRTVTETFADMDGLAAAYPDLVALVDLGDSWDKVMSGGSRGYDIRGMVLTRKNNGVSNKFKFFLMAAIHARELTTAELAMRFAEELLAGYGSNPEATWLLDHGELHVVPQCNPDGRIFAESGQYWRKNTDNDDGCSSSSSYGVDLNRNSSYKWNTGGSSSYACDQTYHGPFAASEPEVMAIENYMLSIFEDQRGPGDFDPAPVDTTGVMISLHSYSQLVLYPWGSTSTPAPNGAGLRTLGLKFGYFNRYDIDQSITLYPTSGTTDEWAYGTLGIAGYTFELGTAFFQSCDYFENNILRSNLDALWYAFKSARRPYQTPSGPDVTTLTISPSTVFQGESASISGTADDTRNYSSGGRLDAYQNIEEARYTIARPSWATNGLIPLSMTGSANPTRGFSGTLSTAGMAPGKYLIFVEARDASGTWGAPTAGFLTVSPPLNDAPVVELIAPSNQSVFVAGLVGMTATASDGDGTIAKVEFYQNNIRIGEDPAPPYTLGWNALPGDYVLHAVAEDNGGARTSSAGVSIRVEANLPPQIAWRGPAPNAVIAKPSPVTFDLEATDPEGAMSKVEFFADGTKIGEDTIAPYLFNWYPYSGAYALRAVALDIHGGRTTTDVVNVSVVNPANEPPVAEWLAPVDGAVLTAGSVALSARATDTDGYPVRMMFRVNGEETGADDAAPFTAAWLANRVGLFTLQAVAMDNDGGMATSMPVVVTIEAASTLAFQQGVNGYANARDTYIRANAASVSNSYGSSIALTVDAHEGSPAPAPTQSLLRFDHIFGPGALQVPPGSLINEANLRLYVYNAGSGFQLYPMLKPWEETSTWAALGDGLQVDGIEVGTNVLARVGADNSSANVGGGYVNLNITGLVQAWSDGGLNYGIALLPFPSGDNNIDIASSQYGSLTLRPMLTVGFSLPPLPVASIRVVDDQGGEFGVDREVSFVLSRSPVTSEPLPVGLALSGSASHDDIDGFYTPVMIGPGLASTTLQFSVTSDTVIEGEEYLSVSIVPSPGIYEISDEVQAVATIHDRPFQQWLYQTDPGYAGHGPYADTDRDGDANLIEYFAGTDPNNREQRSWMALMNQPGTSTAMSLHFSRATGRPDIQGRLLWSRNLTNWLESGDVDNGLRVDIDYQARPSLQANMENIEARITTAPETPQPHEAIFLRLQVEEP